MFRVLGLGNDIGHVCFHGLGFRGREKEIHTADP